MCFINFEKPFIDGMRWDKEKRHNNTAIFEFHVSRISYMISIHLVCAENKYEYEDNS